MRDVEEITEVRRVRVRRAGNNIFADIVIAAPRIYTFEQTHELSERVEKAAIDGVHTRSPQAEADVVVHVEPTATSSENEELDLVLHTAFDPHIPLSQAHIQAEEIQRARRHAYPDLGSVVIHTEHPE